MTKPEKPPTDGFVFYVLTLVIAFSLFAIMLVWASRHLWSR